MAHQAQLVSLTYRESASEGEGSRKTLVTAGSSSRAVGEPREADLKRVQRVHLHLLAR